VITSSTVHRAELPEWLRRSPMRSSTRAPPARHGASPWPSTAMCVRRRLGLHKLADRQGGRVSSGRFRVAERMAPSDEQDSGSRLGVRSWVGVPVARSLIVGTGGLPIAGSACERALTASGAEIVTVALRRVDPTATGSALDVIDFTRQVRAPQHGRLHTRPSDAVRTPSWRGRLRDRLDQLEVMRRRSNPVPRTPSSMIDAASDAG